MRVCSWVRPNFSENKERYTYLDQFCGGVPEVLPVPLPEEPVLLFEGPLPEVELPPVAEPELLPNGDVLLAGLPGLLTFVPAPVAPGMLLLDTVCCSSMGS